MRTSSASSVHRYCCSNALLALRSTLTRTCSSLGRKPAVPTSESRELYQMSNATPAEVLAAVADLLPTLRERAQETEDLRRIPDEYDQGPAGHRVLPAAAADPLRRLRGLAGRLLPRACGMIASACGSTGWVSSVLGVHPWQLGIFDDRAQQEVWGDDPSTLVSSSYAPMGRATAAEGGFTFSGRWSFSSGCDHAQWIFLGGLVMGDGRQRRSTSARSCCRAPTTRSRTSGTRSACAARAATTSSSRTRSSPSTARCGSWTPAAASARARPSTPRRSTSCRSRRCSRARSQSRSSAWRQGAYDAYVGWTKERVRASTGGKAADDSFNQMRIAEAAAQIDGAVLQIERNIEEELRLRRRGREDPDARCGCACAATRSTPPAPASPRSTGSSRAPADAR